MKHIEEAGAAIRITWILTIASATIIGIARYFELFSVSLWWALWPFGVALAWVVYIFSVGAWYEFSDWRLRRHLRKGSKGPADPAL